MNMSAEDTHTADVVYEDGDKANMKLKEVLVPLPVSHCHTHSRYNTALTAGGGAPA